MNVYGLNTCDTCKRARRTLDAAGIAYDFHDVREDGVTKPQVSRWAAKVGWQTLLNKSSTTWRDLPHQDKLEVTEEKAVKLMTEHPTLMKRPIIERNGTSVYVGWSKEIENALKT